MLGIAAVLESKVLLHRYIDCEGEAPADKLRDRLIEKHVAPLLRVTLARKALATEEADQVYSLAMGQIVTHLDRLRTARRQDGIEHFRSYVTQIAENAFSRYLEAKYPERTRLKNQIVYILKHQAGLVAGVGKSGRTLCGLAEWGTPLQEPPLSPRLLALRDDPVGSADRALPDQEASSAHLRTLIAVLLFRVGHPIDLETMVGALAVLKNVQDVLPSPGCGEEEDAPETDPADPNVDLEGDVQKRAFLVHLWEEIKRLPFKQRACLLWNMRDTAESNMLDLLVTTRTTRYEEIAQALETPWEAFVALWKKVPLEDKQIAELLQITEGNVRVQRHTARARLQLRMQSYAEPTATHK